MVGEHAILFAVGDRTKGKYGYASLIEWSTTSFYIKSQYRPLQVCKVSIHNPDPRHPGKHGFRFDFEHAGPKRKATAAGGSWILGGAQLPLSFPGRRVNAKVKHLVRFAVAWDMFTSQIPSAPVPKVKQKVTLHALLEPPRLLRASYVDVFMAEGRPYWPDERDVRAKNAGMGPIANSDGMFLTAVDRRVKVTDEPDPFGRTLDAAAAVADCVRGIATKVDPAGFLWLCEKLMPKQGPWQQS